LNILRRFWPYLKDYKLQFSIAIFGMVISAIGTSASAYLVKPVLDEIFIQKDASMLSILPPLVIFLYFLKGFGKFIQVYYTEYIGQDIIRRLRQNMLQTLLSMQIDFFIKESSGNLISRLTNDINRIKEVVANMVPDFLRELFTVFALMFVVIYQSPKLALYFLFIMPLSIYPLSRLAKRMRKISKHSQETLASLTTRLTEIFNNIELIKAEAKEHKELERFATDNNQFFKLSLKQVQTNEFVSPLMELLGAVIIALVIYVGGKEVIEGRMSTGEFFSFMTALFMLYTPIKHLSKLYNKIQDAIVASERIFKIIDLTPTITSGSKPPPKEPKKLCFEDVTLEYEESVKALENINFCFQRGMISAIVGDSGSGKSSTINLIVRFYDPVKGKVKVDGVNLKEIDLKEWRKQIALVTQQIYLFQESVAVNIGGEEFDEKRVIEALKKAHAYEFVKKLPLGINTPLKEAGMNLSGGQRQRLAIARALYKNAQIFIFDEATSALDKKAEQEILETIKELAREKIVILISHNLKSVAFADNIIVLQKGKKVCEGEHDKLVRFCQTYIELYNRS